VLVERCGFATGASQVPRSNSERIFPCCAGVMFHGMSYSTMTSNLVRPASRRSPLAAGAAPHDESSCREFPDRPAKRTPPPFV
jgi:hypothetical protein